MTNKLLTFIKSNWIIAVLVVIVLFLVSKSMVSTSYLGRSYLGNKGSGVLNTIGGVGNLESLGAPSFIQQDIGGIGGGGGYRAQDTAGYNPNNYVSPTPNISDRMVITNSYVNSVVENVESMIGLVKSNVQGLGGYVVSSYMTKDDSTGTGTITVRIPLGSLDNFLAFVRDNSVKISSENIEGTDITDQYVDIDDKIKSLEETIAVIENIKSQATDVNDIINIQNRIFSLKSQVDSYKGQKEFYENSSKTVLIGINLSTDEYSLPYSEPLSWRPDVVFKLAVRSLLDTLKGLGTLGIWLAVYSVLIIPSVLLGILIIKVFVKLVNRVFKI